MFLMRRLTVASDIFNACCISTSERALTRKLKTFSSSSVKLHSRRNRSHSGSVNSVLMFRGAHLFFFLVLTLTLVPFEPPDFRILATILAIKNTSGIVALNEISVA